jgi:DNA-binding CsgD family transcriptional regulator
MKRVRAFPKLVQQDRESAAGHPDLFVVCERSGGIAQLRAELYGNLDCTIERIAGMMAVQCLVRGQEPEGFMVLIPADRALVDRAVSRAKALLEEGRSMAGPVSLSPRQKEILRAILSDQANKEIASRLNITVRTVKFHISSLLAKFGVENRTELARRAAGVLRSAVSRNELNAPEHAAEYDRRAALRPVAVGEPFPVPSNGRNIRFPSRPLHCAPQKHRSAVDSTSRLN